MENNNRQNIKNEVITLILADMRNRKLVMGLDAVGLSTDEFNTNLSELIFEKIGIGKQHEIHIGNWYEDIVFNILDNDLQTFRQHQLFFAITIYEALQEESRKLETKLMVKSKSKFSALQSIGFRRFDN